MARDTAMAFTGWNYFHNREVIQSAIRGMVALVKTLVGVMHLRIKPDGGFESLEMWKS